MSCTMFLSMWISNTAAVALMVPIVDSISEAMFADGDIDVDNNDEKPRQRTKDQEARRNLMLLACAYAANIGGTGVITGTPPNLVVLGTLESDYGSKGGKHPLSYATWMAFSVPLMLLNTVIAWTAILIIQRVTVGPETSSKDNDAKVKKVILSRKQALGPMTLHEVQVVLLFLTLILLWFFRSPKFMPGWSDAITNDVYHGETQRDPPSRLKIASATPAVFIVALTFILRQNYQAKTSSPALLDWNTG